MPRHKVRCPSCSGTMWNRSTTCIACRPKEATIYERTPEHYQRMSERTRGKPKPRLIKRCA